MKKLAVHLHLYYQEYLPKILHYLENLKGSEYDLCVTLNKENPAIEQEIKKHHPSAKIWQVANRGYDIGPFIDFLNHINLDDYEYILKLHTKGRKSKNYTRLNGRRLDNALWGKILWDSMLSSKERLSENIRLLKENPEINMVGSKYCLTNASQDYAKLLPEINGELKKIGQKPVEKLSFVAGSMFLAKAKIFTPLQNYKIEDFALTDGNVKEGTLAHIVERINGVLGGKIYPVSDKNYILGFIRVWLKRFIYQQKITKSGVKVIKIMKLPVWFKKERAKCA